MHLVFFHCYLVLFCWFGIFVCCLAFFCHFGAYLLCDVRINLACVTPRVYGGAQLQLVSDGLIIIKQDKVGKSVIYWARGKAERLQYGSNDAYLAMEIS